MLTMRWFQFPTHNLHLHVRTAGTHSSKQDVLSCSICRYKCSLEFHWLTPSHHGSDGALLNPHCFSWIWPPQISVHLPSAVMVVIWFWCAGICEHPVQPIYEISHIYSHGSSRPVRYTYVALNPTAVACLWQLLSHLIVEPLSAH